ncbi:MAG: hypothetical protein OEY39_03370 [Candidatus Bathyarchaeota archaeon]|nr:hypothetical protein [Candidatus Bathyarchaeota archaeon]MDH5419643.1 hypothetical protein [Candidatus Bathyarchaeota archaeon]MDH5623489.1 hypothetical protein [Candidatus Bathyarchaeota archaeon]MDH5635453.1 hypothetical protein [Candidatus Bathyarchaeota archaeon]MDH5701781.1 hypothetical protein [Candidatus Bathyarchaeota archaeon]
MKRKAYYARKIKRAAHLLFYRRHRNPGVKGWELRRRLGSDYPKVIKILDDHLEKLDLTVKTVFEGEKPAGEPTLEQLDKARFYTTLRGGLAPKETKMMGWRIDDIAGLATAISYIIAKKGKAPREEVEELLRNKLPGWRVDINMNRYIRYGYLAEDENKQLYLDWRTRAEIDQKALVDLLLSKEKTLNGYA